MMNEQRLLTVVTQRTKLRFVVFEKVDEHPRQPPGDKGTHDNPVVELDGNFILRLAIV